MKGWCLAKLPCVAAISTQRACWRTCPRTSQLNRIDLSFASVFDFNLSMISQSGLPRMRSESLAPGLKPTCLTQ